MYVNDFQVTLSYTLCVDDLPHSSPQEVAKRLRELAKGLTDAEDIAAVNKYVDELERLSQTDQPDCANGRKRLS